MTATVYRCCDFDGRLLYVGCTEGTVATRMSCHRRRWAWTAQVTRTEQDHYVDVDEARKAEAALIHALHPEHNRQHRSPVAPSVAASAVNVTGLMSVGDTAKALGWSRAKVKRAALNGDLPCAVKMPGETGAYLFDSEVVGKLSAPGDLPLVGGGAS